MDKLIITVAVTGQWPTKEQTPYVPLQPKEIAEEIYKCWEAGASVAHIHVRDEKGEPVMEEEKFEEVVNLVRATDCDIILNLTTSGDSGCTEEQRYGHVVKLKPEMASYDAGSMNFMHRHVFMNPPKFLEKLGMILQENDVKPELEIFDTGMVYNTLHYLNTGVLKAPLYYQFVLGAPGGLAATIENLVYLKNLIPKGSTWSAFGIGKDHLPILFASIALGGHVRVGMEDNVYYSKGVLAKSNVEFVERSVRLGKEFGREIATPNEARKILGIK